jgi:simple sugar transport system permease protein
MMLIMVFSVWLNWLPAGGWDKPYSWILPITAYGALLEGSLGSIRGIGNTLNATTPLILTGLSVAFAFRAGLFNIGAPGQFFVGAFVAAIVGAGIGLPFPLLLLLSLFMGFLGGAAWGFIPGALKAWR